MSVNPVVNCTFIIRSQAEYSAATRTVNVRCVLEMPATGQHRGFATIDAMLATLRTELTAMHSQIMPKPKEE